MPSPDLLNLTVDDHETQVNLW
ncbi:hypothetical protein CCACVL1_18193 [Corchorus capsularis]|uniref:Uncharacterized protein n=1 Tax=Corchorus capsularis TaxID=210143 RepID=A0A1R3HMG8_COCAP|nr:hypothetical protein CCACVL1_18193 [Corchorus capsularis]